MKRSAAPMLTLALLTAACAATVAAQTAPAPAAARPVPDPRVGLRPGLFDAGEAAWNLRLVSTSPPPREFVGAMNSDLAFTGRYVIQGNFNGFAIWDISEPARPVRVKTFVCPASQSDVSVYRNLLFVSGEDYGARLDCGTQGVREPVSAERFRGIRVFDISDIANPRYITNVQTCRGSHTHSLLEHPGDTANVYVYVSGSAPVRPEAELAGCRTGPPADSASALFRIEVIRVPLADPARAAIVSSPRIFGDLAAPPVHGRAVADSADLAAARARGAFVLEVPAEPVVIPDDFVAQLLADIVRARNGTGSPTAADSAALREQLRRQAAAMAGDTTQPTGPNQCHDITLAPGLGLAGGACEGYGLLLDIRDPVNPRRLDAVADSNFAYWHSATLNNDGTSILFSDEWGGGAGAKCRASDPRAWGADAIFRIRDGRMQFASYYKLPAAQTSAENCVAHNGSLIPIPGRDVMAQAWYQGGISVLDFTDPANPVEIAFHDRGPVDASRVVMAGSWSVYWYNGLLVSSEIARGLDILELLPSAWLSANELAAARTVRQEYLNTQGQARFTWPPSFALARAYVDQIERARTLGADRIATIRRELDRAERESGGRRGSRLTQLARQLDRDAAGRAEAAKVQRLAASVRDLAAM